MTSSSHGASTTIRDQHTAALAALPFSDAQDFEDANRGLIAPLDEPVLAPDGTVLWDNSTYDFLEGEAPDTVNPSLWRQSQLARSTASSRSPRHLPGARHGSVEHHPHRGRQGVIVIDTLLSVETGAAALALYRKHRGDRAGEGGRVHPLARRPLRGRPGLRLAGGGRCGRGEVIAPEGFIEHAVSENVYAGTAMNRRAATCTAHRWPVARRGRCRARADRQSLGTRHVDRAHRCRDDDRSGGDRRRGPDGLPDGA